MHGFLLTLVSSILALIPLSYLGIWRWCMWGTKRICGLFYRPKMPSRLDIKARPKISVVVPVYNEDPDILRQALDSWITNGIDEIIAVIDASNSDLIYLFDRNYCPLKKVTCKLVVTPKPGKRAALADGMLLTTGEIISLIDSDAVWGEKILSKVLPYFDDPTVGGVTTQQRVLKPKTIAQVLFDIILWVRYHEEVPFLLGAGTSVNTLSGRTAFYRREALFNSKHDVVHDLTHEFYGNSRCISGDDKRLTHLVLEDGWNLEYAYNAVIYTAGAKDLKTFLQQRLRWIRNSWRADTRAFQRRWVFRHPALAFHNFDRFIQPFFMLIGPIAFVISLLYHRWTVAGLIVAWWFVSRFIKLFGYFRAHPARVFYLPAYIIFSYWNSVVKIYAWATILEQGWITRWDAKRLAIAKRFTFIQGATATIGVIFLIFGATWRYYAKAQTWTGEGIIATTIGTQFSLPLLPTPEPTRPSDAVAPGDLHTYTVARGDTLSSVAAKLGVQVSDLRFMNNIVNRNQIATGEVLYTIVQVTPETKVAELTATPTPIQEATPSVTPSEKPPKPNPTPKVLKVKNSPTPTPSPTPDRGPQTASGVVPTTLPADQSGNLIPSNTPQQTHDGVIPGVPPDRNSLNQDLNQKLKNLPSRQPR